MTNAIEKTHLECRFRQQREELELFAAAAAHDLRSPLQGIALNTGMLRERLKGRAGEKIERCLNRIQHKAKVFAPVNRLHSKGVYEGSGLGLALCKRMVDQHHGRIWVDSQEGGGATFFFTLPGRSGQAA